MRLHKTAVYGVSLLVQLPVRLRKQVRPSEANTLGRCHWCPGCLGAVFRHRIGSSNAPSSRISRKASSDQDKLACSESLGRPHVIVKHGRLKLPCQIERQVMLTRLTVSTARNTSQVSGLFLNGSHSQNLWSSYLQPSRPGN